MPLAWWNTQASSDRGNRKVYEVWSFKLGSILVAACYMVLLKSVFQLKLAVTLDESKNNQSFRFQSHAHLISFMSSIFITLILFKI